MASAPRAICRRCISPWQAAILCLSLCGALAGCGGRAAAPPTTQDALRAKLRRPISLAARDEPRDEVLKRIGREQGIDIEIDEAALEAESLHLSKDREVTLELRDIPLASALHVLLRQAGGLTFDIDGAGLRVTTPAARA